MHDETVYNGWLKVVKRKVGDRTYDILKDYNAVCAIIVNECHEILLVRQFRPALLRETLELPAGSLDVDGEDAVSCLLRELKEETGMDFCAQQVEPVLSYQPMMGFSSSLMKVYLIRVKKDALKQTDFCDEDVMDTVWVELGELGDKIAGGQILDVKTILAYYYLRSMKQL